MSNPPPYQHLRPKRSSMRDLGARTKVVLILLAVLTMLGCQALNASKPTQVSQSSQSSQTATSQDSDLTPNMAVLDWLTCVGLLAFSAWQPNIVRTARSMRTTFVRA